MANIYQPGEGYVMGVYAFMNGPLATDNTFLQQLPKKQPVHYAQDLELAISNGRINVAKEVGYGGMANLNQHTPYIRNMYRFPLFKETLNISGATLQKRAPEHNPFAQTTPAAQQAYWMTEGYRALYSKLIVTREAMMSEMLLTGKIVFETSPIVDLKRDPSLMMTSDNPWNVGGSHNPTTDLAEMVRKIGSKSGKTAKAIVMSSQTFTLMQNSTTFESLAKFTYSPTRLDVSQMNDRGGVYTGTIVAGGYQLDVWTYDGLYIDSKGVEQQFIPAGKVIVGNFDLNNPYMSWYFGATDVLPIFMDMAKQYGVSANEARALVRNGEIVPYAFAGADHMTIGLQSAMLPIPSDINAYGVLTAY